MDTRELDRYKRWATAKEKLTRLESEIKAQGKDRAQLELELTNISKQLENKKLSAEEKNNKESNKKQLLACLGNLERLPMLLETEKGLSEAHKRDLKDRITSYQKTTCLLEYTRDDSGFFILTPKIQLPAQP